jgi:hypothetical protein
MARCPVNRPSSVPAISEAVLRLETAAITHPATLGAASRGMTRAPELRMSSTKLGKLNMILRTRRPASNSCAS